MPSIMSDVDRFEAARPRLEAIAYRLLGSASEAEDAVQETYLRWQAADTGRIEVPEAWLTKVLTNHVVPGRLAPDQLPGEHKTLAGTTLTVTGSGEAYKVGEANVVCGNVQTANATVYIIDQVLTPPDR